MLGKESLFINSLTLKGSNQEKRQKSESALQNEIEILTSEILELQTKITDLIEKRDRSQKELDQLLKNNVLLPLHLNKPHSFYNAQAKALFLLSFFSPRLDIFAVRGANKQSKKNVGYYPSCDNRWKRNICPKFRIEGYSCKNCDNRHMRPLTANELIFRNFKNKDEEHFYGSIGMYPLRDGNVTRFVAIDLDSETYLDDATSIVKTARDMGISMLWERSSSGNGMHLWIIFSEDVSAKDARALAFLIIDRARELNDNISLKSYDRLFPSQDEVKKNGFGNLILFPLIKSAARYGNTLFLDDSKNAYPADEQVEYLSSVHRHSDAELQSFLVAYKESYLTDDFKLESEDINPEWMHRIPKISISDIKGDFIVYISSGLTFDKNCLSKKAQEALRRYAMVANPLYYRRLNSNDGKIANDVPSRIALFEENERVIKIPRGLKGAIFKYFDKSKIRYKMEDHRVSYPISVSFKGSLYPLQEKALSAMMKKESGILNLATGGGKTVISLALIAKYKVRTLIIVHSSNLLHQWEDEAIKMLEIEDVPDLKRKSKKVKHPAIGIIGDGQRRWSHIIDIATVQSLSKMLDRGDFSFCDQYGMVVVDECHHIAAMSTRHVVSNMSAKYVYGLSATLKRGDGLEKVIFYECGGPLFSYDHASLARDRGLKQYYVARALDTRLPQNRNKVQFNEILDFISDDEIRCQIIADDIESAYLRDQKIIVFTRRLSQNKALGDRLKEKSIPYCIFDSNSSKDEVVYTLNELKEMDVPDVIIATDKFFGEGIDIPNLDTVFLASPYMQEGTVSQVVGRIARACIGKDCIFIYDYVDYEIPRLNYMFSARLRLYRKLGFVALEDATIPYKRHIYDDSDYLEDLLKDMDNAKKEIVISTTFALPSNSTRKIFSSFSEAEKRGVAISLRGEIRNENDDIKSKLDGLLHQMPIAITSVNHAKNYIAIDKEIVWYGELNMLAVSSKTQQKSERTFVLRIVNSETANAIIENDSSLI